MIGDTLKKAHELLTGARNDERGDPLPVYERAAEIYTAWTGHFVDANNMVEMMIACKMARAIIGKKHSADNAVDIAAYWDIHEDIETRNGQNLRNCAAVPNTQRTMQSNKTRFGFFRCVGVLLGRRCVVFARPH